MKKIIALFLTFVMLFSLAACSGISSKTYHKLGETVSTDIFEFTLDAAEFAIALNNVNNDDYFTPKEYNPEYDANNPFVASTGHTFAAFTFTVKNLNRTSDELYNSTFATVKYDGKNHRAFKQGAFYLYEGKYILDEYGNKRTQEAGEWHSDPSSNFLLDAGAKESRRAYIDVAADVKDLTDDIEITFEIPNSEGKKVKFTYLVTEADRAAMKKQ